MRKEGICLLPVIPVRKEDTELSEMVTQVLFGETVQILDEREKWLYIKIDTDSYEGWIDRKMLSLISEKQYETIKELPLMVLPEIITKVFSNSLQSYYWLPAGSIIRGVEPGVNGFKLNGELFSFEKAPLSIELTTRDKLIETASQFLNSPYLWGGKTVFGMDCSGFTQLVMKINGIEIPRDARQQVEKGIALSFITEGQPGDLAFFDNEEGEITHTGIMMSKDMIIHASGKVRIDRFDHQGIFNIELNRYTHKLRIIKNYF